LDRADFSPRSHRPVHGFGEIVLCRTERRNVRLRVRFATRCVERVSGILRSLDSGVSARGIHAARMAHPPLRATREIQNDQTFAAGEPATRIVQGRYPASGGSGIGMTFTSNSVVPIATT